MLEAPDSAVKCAGLSSYGLIVERLRETMTCRQW